MANLVILSSFSDKSSLASTAKVREKSINFQTECVDMLSKPVYLCRLFNMHKIVSMLVSIIMLNYHAYKEEQNSFALCYFSCPGSRDSRIIMRNHILSIASEHDRK